MRTLFLFVAIFSNILTLTSATVQENNVEGCQDDTTDELSLMQNGLRVQAKGEYIEEHRKTDVSDLKEADAEMLREWNDMKENGAFNVVTVKEMESLALKLKNIWDERTAKTLLDARRVEGPDSSVALEQSISGKEEQSFDKAAFTKGLGKLPGAPAPAPAGSLGTRRCMDTTIDAQGSSPSWACSRYWEAELNGPPSKKMEWEAELANYKCKPGEKGSLYYACIPCTGSGNWPCLSIPAR